MSTIRLREEVYIKVHKHLFSKVGEHFAFLLADWCFSNEEPIFLVRDTLLIPDEQVTINKHGWELSTEVIVGVINKAIQSGLTLIEVHNHQQVFPRFSSTDRGGLQEFPKYVLSSLNGRPYGATVWGETKVYGEYFLEEGHHGVISSITVVASRLRQLISCNDDRELPHQTFDRQLPWFTTEIQQQMKKIKIGVLGGGGTGSQIILALTCLGGRDFLLIDDDIAEGHSMNRLVTASAKDIGEHKVVLGERWIRTFAPDAKVRIIQDKLQSIEALDSIKGVDIIFGCGDNDGVRLILNEIALAYSIPYFDLGVEIRAQEGILYSAAGRVAVVLPDGPCLNCMRQIDWKEARYTLNSQEDKAFQRARGYVSGMDVVAPAVGPLNGIIANAAALEFALFVSGQRVSHPFTEYDLLGIGRGKDSQWLAPRRNQVTQEGCIQCTLGGKGDAACNVERYASNPDHIIA